jgi:hypothetical protein
MSATTSPGPASGPTPEQAVAVLLHAAGVSVPADEEAELVASYPALRVSLDALHAVPIGHEEEPQLVFSPLP